MGDLAGLIGAVVSIAAVALSLWAIFRAEKVAQAVRDSDARRDSDLDRHGSITEYVRDIRDWGARALLVVAEMHETFKANLSTAPADRNRLLAHLSSLIDEGRLLFPNEQHDSYGLHKAAAYRGVRQPILDDLVYIYDLFGSGELFGERAGVAEFDELRRDFVSQLQLRTNPDRLTIDQLRAQRAERDTSSDLFRRAKANAQKQD